MKIIFTIAISNPPPSANPSIAATIGFLEFSITLITLLHLVIYSTISDFAVIQ